MMEQERKSKRKGAKKIKRKRRKSEEARKVEQRKGVRWEEHD